MLEAKKSKAFDVAAGQSSGPPAWVGELISRLDEDLLDKANEQRDPLAEEPDEDAASMETESPPPFNPGDIAGHGPGGANGPAAEGFSSGKGSFEDDGAFFDSIFGWLTELLASIFGKPGEEGVADAPAPPVNDLPDAPAEPGAYMPDPPPDMSGDIVLIEYIPGLPVDESGTGAEDLEEDDLSEFI